MTDISSTPSANPLEGDPLLTTRQAASVVSTTEGALRMSRVRGRLFGLSAPPWINIGRAVRYRRADLDRWLASATEEHHPSQKRA